MFGERTEIPTRNSVKLDLPHNLHSLGHWYLNDLYRQYVAGLFEQIMSSFFVQMPSVKIEYTWLFIAT